MGKGVKGGKHGRVKGGIMCKGEKRVRVKGVNKAGEKGARI